MKEFGNQYKRAITNIKTIFGKEYDNRDQEKYANVLNSIDYPDWEEDVLKGYADEAQELLHTSICPYKGTFFRNGLEISKLGKPKGYRKEELPQEMERLSAQMARLLLGYDEEFDLSVSYSTLNEQEMHLGFRLALEGADRDALMPLLRGVYSQAAAEEFTDQVTDPRYCYYGVLTVPYRDKNWEQEKNNDRNFSNWVDSVLATLPENTNYRVTLKLIPLKDAALADLQSQMEALQHMADKLMLYAEADWNQSTNTGASYNREKNILKQLEDKIKHMCVGVERVSGTYGETFSQTRHEKNKRVELLLRQIDQRVYLLNKALQAKAWQVVLRVVSADEIAVQNVSSAISGTLKRDGYLLEWQEGEPCICAVLPSEELLPLIKFPTKEFIGFEFVENEEFSLSSPAKSGMDIGALLWNKNAANRFCLPEKALNRHAFVCGMTGSGKTNTLFKLLETAGVPFMVIEPVKGEYRALQSHYRDLQIYTMKADGGIDEHTSMLRINPFWFPERTNIAFHIDSIKTIIASAFEMTNAMPNILEQCMYSIYIKAGWNIVTGKNQYAGTIPDEFLYPTFADLLDEIDYYLDNSKFGSETLGDYRGAMSTRLKSFVNSYKGLLLNTVEHPDYGKLMQGRSVLELEGLADDADKCLVMGTILVQYFEYLKLHFSVSNKALQHLVVIEEAHRLFKNGGRGSHAPRVGTDADPTGQLVESLSNIMAEIRAFGEGMIIVDQSPSKVAEDVIKNSSTKIIHRVDNDTDIRLLQSALLISEDQTSLPSLEQGEALIRTDGMRRPCKVKVDRSVIKDNYQLSTSFQNSDVQPDTSLENTFAAMAILSEDIIAEQIRGELWCLLMKFQSRGFESWKDHMDQYILSVIRLLHSKRKYDLMDGKSSVIRHLTAQSIRQLRAQSGVSIGVYEIGSIHLFVQRLFDFYEDVCEGYSMKEGNIALFAEYYSRDIAPLVVEYAQVLKNREKKKA